jgi:hypothetical protein
MIPQPTDATDVTLTNCLFLHFKISWSRTVIICIVEARHVVPGFGKQKAEFPRGPRHHGFALFTYLRTSSCHAG